MKRREVTLEQVEAGMPWSAPSLLTGVSGSGKNYVVGKAIFPNDFKVLLLDTIGAKVDGKWTVDVAKIPESTDMVVGTCDNLIEVANYLRDLYEEGAKFTLYYVDPDPDLFRASVAAKAAEASNDSPFKKGWAESSKRNDAWVRKYVNGKLDMLVKKLNPDELVIINNHAVKGEVVKGFHESKGGKS